MRLTPGSDVSSFFIYVTAGLFFFNRNVYIYPRDVPNPLRAAILCVFLHVWIGRSGEGYLTTTGDFILYTETCDTTDSVCCFPKYY